MMIQIRWKWVLLLLRQMMIEQLLLLIIIIIWWIAHNIPWIQIIVLYQIAVVAVKIVLVGRRYGPQILQRYTISTQNRLWLCRRFLVVLAATIVITIIIQISFVDRVIYGIIKYFVVVHFVRIVVTICIWIIQIFLIIIIIKNNAVCFIFGFQFVCGWKETAQIQQWLGFFR